MTIFSRIASWWRETRDVVSHMQPPGLYPVPGPSLNDFQTIIKPAFVLPEVAPGEVKAVRNWEDKQTDTTVLVVGGQVHPEHLEAVKQILRGEAHATRFPRGRVKVKGPIGGTL